jgi:hypothetical protein
MARTLECTKSLKGFSDKAVFFILTPSTAMVERIKAYFGADRVMHVPQPQMAQNELFGFRHANVSEVEIEHLMVEWFLLGSVGDAVVTHGSSLAISALTRAQPGMLPLYITPTPELMGDCVRRTWGAFRCCFAVPGSDSSVLPFRRLPL